MLHAASMSLGLGPRLQDNWRNRNLLVLLQLVVLVSFVGCPFALRMRCDGVWVCTCASCIIDSSMLGAKRHSRLLHREQLVRSSLHCLPFVVRLVETIREAYTAINQI